MQLGTRKNLQQFYDITETEYIYVMPEELQKRIESETYLFNSL